MDRHTLRSLNQAAASSKRFSEGERPDQGQGGVPKVSSSFAPQLGESGL